MENVNYERIRNKSINNKNMKKIKISGELYRGKHISKKDVKNYLLLIAGIIVWLAAAKGDKYYETVDTYNRVLKNTVNDELSYSDSQDFLENYNVSNNEHYINYREALSNLDDNKYKKNGDRIDGTHNEIIPSDGGAIVNLSDKQKDAIIEAVNDEISDFKRGK